MSCWLGCSLLKCGHWPLARLHKLGFNVPVGTWRDAEIQSPVTIKLRASSQSWLRNVLLFVAFFCILADWNSVGVDEARASFVLLSFRKGCWTSVRGFRVSSSALNTTYLFMSLGTTGICQLEPNYTRPN